MFQPFNFWNIPLWGKIGSLTQAATSSADLILWMILFAALLILGILWLKKLRNEAKNGPVEISDEEILDQFEKYYRKKLITYEEYQLIRRNLRDQLVFDLLETEKKEKSAKENNRKNGTAPMSDSDKEERLRALLRGMSQKK